MGISGWRRGRIIGRGTSATVSLATSVPSGEVFAVKSSELSRSWLLQREQRILSALDSPFVVSYFGFDVAAQTPGAGLCYNLFMEYAPRGSLSDEIRKQGGRLDELAIRSYACDILGGLAYLHSNGVVHCDLKSQNVLICSGGRAKVADFGCARSAEEEDEDERGWMRGTPMFMAPEVARGEEQSAPADIWALGCTVIEMATGRPPWPLVSDALSALHQIAFSTDVPEFPRWISEEGRDFLSRCLRRDPLERWTAEQLLQHPFVAASRVANPPSKSDWISPKSTLDQAFLQSLSDDDDDGQVLDQTEEDPFERMQSLIGDAAPNWTWDENWVTVRSNGGFPVTESITEDGRPTNPITDSSEQLMLSTNPMATGHVRDNSSSDHNLSETSVVPIAEGLILTCKTETCNFENANFYSMNKKERTQAPFGHHTPIFPSTMSNSYLWINAPLQLLSH
ncbi:unnamed protein product [Musa acuminata subsp. malaccensis]|uniref:(wild Malaysian banana) hypothetical protein n=1 Tax=Musa acuminata subsp. malaccensis TaxID=214687 RepID=A0A804JEB9_MUSAM|nr:PREDICTED: mitogen-activated protein kinase kinase kinase NPK1-like [Musa acuminata subsp. malaccensis]CAG1845737.1 unnamed protein product [Musa acuminata subsp. malaccensis]